MFVVFLLQRTRTDAIYKTETPQLPERPLLSWRVLRWAIIPVILLILLMATIYTIICRYNLKKISIL